MSDVILWLFVIFCGLAAGAGLYEMRINVPRWFPRRGGVVVVDAEATPAMAAQWEQLNLIRALLTLVGWLFALKALALTG